jgi:hypothetical protein
VIPFPQVAAASSRPEGDATSCYEAGRGGLHGKVELPDALVTSAGDRPPRREPDDTVLVAIDVALEH